ncbi:porin [Avibacterium gallinarum]|uniref:Major outer membrane protein OmpH-2 n=1 Tax=Avibacterium gallinarum TaxID=755 RepID=A0A379AWX7_AVIGA|nr:porin [Avibacterium gallinarum]POY44522.1 porin [Avibacterium gallinarum]TDP30306.1 putative porin [Avibacterium gallinarum]SUB26806.1 major outer membrane protein OmpH-2 [Avibacterium gallinarum]
MKKTLIALAVTAMISATANATVIYEKEGTKIDLDGRMHFELRNDANNRTDLRDVGSRVRVRAYQELGAGFSAYGGVELRFSNDNGDAGSIGSNLRTHRLYAGLIQKDIGILTFGSQLHLGDHIPKANYTYEWGSNILFDGHKKAAHFMSAKFAGVRFATDYYFGQANKANNKSSGTTAWNEGQGYGVGLFYDNTFGDFGVRFGAGYTTVTQSSDGTKANEFKLKRSGIGLELKYNIVRVGFDWAHGKVSKSDKESGNLVFQKIAGYNEQLNRIDRFLLGVKVDVTKQNAVYGQYYFAKGKKADASLEPLKMRGWMVGADHRFNKNFAVYVEGGQGRVKQAGKVLNKNQKTNHRVLVGARFLF